MKIYLRGELIDTEKEVVVMLFENDDDRINHANNISNMEPKEGAKRLYAIFPDSTPVEEVREIMSQAKEKGFVSKSFTFLDEVNFMLLEPNGFVFHEETKIDETSFCPYKEITHPDHEGKVFKYTPEYAQDINGPQGRIDMMPIVKEELEKFFGVELLIRKDE